MTAIATNLPAFDTSSEASPYQGQLPVAISFTAEEERAMANPLQHLPVVGTIYRAITGEQTPAPVQIADSMIASAAFGGPIGLVGCLLFNLAKELIALGPDTSRPPVPDGMDATGSETAMRIVPAGTAEREGGYTSLATTQPDFLRGAMQLAEGGGDAGSTRTVVAALSAYDWQRTAMLEHGAAG